MNRSRTYGRLARVSFFAAAVTGALALAPASVAHAEPPSSFTTFESGQVRPLALSPNGKLLFAVNTPDNRLEVFRVKDASLVHRASIPVGLEPVAVAARSDTEVWVVNHLSDSVSVVELSSGGFTGRVTRTLLTGDEPRDIVFAGPGRARAFITTAHRGQNVPYDPQFLTPGVGRADVWVFNASNLGSSLGGAPLTIVPLFTDTPRALAVTPDGSRVYAAGFHTGNRTTIIADAAVPDGGQAAGGLIGPATNAQGAPRPETGMIVKYNGSHWVDLNGRAWDAKVRFNLPDKDVFVLDAMANPPAQLAGSAGYYANVGTVLFNMAVNPVSGKVYVSNTEALNDQLFEGPGVFAGRTLRGHFDESRITVLSGAGGVTPRHLNKHINYASCCAPTPNAESEKSLAMPQSMAVTSDGSTLYVAALGSSKIGVFSTAALENNTFVPSSSSHITVSGGGPTGIVLSDSGSRLFALTRFDNSISVINTATKAEIIHVAMYNPEPQSVVVGRRFLYDARATSSHGDSSCASCHVFGDLDSLAWDLGNPDDVVKTNPGPFTSPPFPTGNPNFHPMKGPMVTQSLRGLKNHGSMHWRGDRTGGNDEPTSQPDSGTYNERAAFRQFNQGFTSLLGRSAELCANDMEAFTDFALQVSYPPNPVRPLSNVLTPLQQAGETTFFTRQIDVIGACASCHIVNEEAGNFGATGLNSFSVGVQFMKIPQLRSVYQKVGMFGMPELPGVFFYGDFSPTGDQIRGFGYGHDGFVDSLFRFTSSGAFQQGFGMVDGIPPGAPGEQTRRELAEFLLAFPTNLMPMVGQQVTLSPTTAAVAGPRIDLMKQRSEAGDCDLVVKTSAGTHELGYLYIGGGQFLSNRKALPALSDALLRLIASVTGAELTYTCVPPGSGERIGLDRDGDRVLDGDEDDAGTDPADASDY